MIFATIRYFILWRFVYKKSIPIAFYYLIVGLLLMHVLFLGMHYDIVIAGHLYYWWFWTVYIFGMYFVDFTMALVLIINKDILGLYKLKGWLRNNKFIKGHDG